MSAPPESKPPTRPLWRAAAPLLAATLGVGGVLALLAAAHPGLRFVDFLSFAGRARRLSEGQELINHLYPVGYPALLVAARAALGDVLVAGKVLSVLAGVGAFLAGFRLAGLGPALAMAALPAFLTWGSTEGTDLLAAAFALGSLAVAPDRPALAGVLAGAAALTRYTGIAALPAALLLTPRRGHALLAFALATAPHWVLALWSGAPVLPDQSENLAIGAGRPVSLLSWETLRRWPANLGRAAGHAFGSPAAALGAVGLLVALARRSRVALGLSVYALLHLLGISLAFSNPRLVLPATLAAGLGLGGLLPTRVRPWLALPAVALLLAQVPGGLRVEEEERALAAVAAIPAPLPVISASPLYYQRHGGWLVSAASMNGLGQEPRRLTPERLIEAARARGFRALALESGRVRVSYPGLKPLLRAPPPSGLSLIGSAGTWQVFALDRREADHTPTDGAGL